MMAALDLIITVDYRANIAQNLYYDLWGVLGGGLIEPEMY